jgi:hypothetical protein
VEELPDPMISVSLSVIVHKRRYTIMEYLKYIQEIHLQVDVVHDEIWILGQCYELEELLMGMILQLGRRLLLQDLL